MNKVISCLAVMTVAIGLVFSNTPVAQEPGDVWERIRASELQPDLAVEIHDVEVDMAMGRLQLEDGILIPAAPVGGRSAEMVFIGDGRFKIDPPDALEENQLDLFTDQEALDVAVEQVVLTVGDRETARILLERDPVATLDSEIAEQAERVFAEWVKGAERRGFGADLAIFGSIFDDVDSERFFAAWIRSEDLGDFYYLFDPTELEQVTLGQFNAIDADYREEHQIRRQIKKGKRKGDYKQLRFEDLGNWDTWISTPLRAGDGSMSWGSAGVEPSRYTIDATVLPGDERLEGKARIEITPNRDGKRILVFTLMSELEVAEIRSGDGQPWPWFRSGGQLYVTLPESTRKGQTIEIDIEYAGKALVELVKSTTYALANTYAWYPHIGDIDRATYDVTLRWPKKHELLAGGRVVDSGEESGMRWERRTLDVRAFAFSFEIGSYDVRTEKIGHVDVTVAFAKGAASLDKGVKDEVMATLREALPFYEETFGDYSLDHLTVATVPRGFSQGFLGFLTLSHSLVGRSREGYAAYDSSFEDFSEYRQESRTETLAHELSHQWWGNKVGWNNYRDQWLSEALADFSASMFMAHQADRKSVYLARRSKSWHSSLRRGTATGRTLESLGPVVMGTRLNSSSGSAYTAVVYDKGSVIFSMLAQLVGEEQLAKMLKILADRVNHQVIDTDTFIMAIEKMGGLSLETFAKQFIYGTGIPEIYYMYEFTPQEDGTWLISGKARQVSASHFRYILEQTDSGVWFVSRSRDEQAQAPASAFIVPFQVALADTEDSVSKGHHAGNKTTTEKGLGGKLLIRGELSEFSVRIPREPRDFWLDQRGQVLAEFYSEKHQPKRMLRYRAIELAAAGRLEEAEALFVRSIGAPLVPEDELDDTDLSKKEIERKSRLQDCLSQIGLARVYLEQERDADARLALDRAEGMLTGLDKDYFRSSRQGIRCHLDLRRGEYESAYGVLSKWLRLDIPVQEGESTADAMRRSKFKSGSRRWGNGLAYAMLAVAAFETGHEDVAFEALKEAEDRGADMDALRPELEGS